MSNIIEAFPQVRQTPFDTPTPKQREAFFEGLLCNARHPRHAPTIMVREKIEGSRTMYFPLNPKAGDIAKHETGDRRKPFGGKILELMAALGFQVEVNRS